MFRTAQGLSGPYPTGEVPPDLLEVHHCDLRVFGVAEVLRMAHILWVFTVMLLAASARQLLRLGGRRSWGEAVAEALRHSFVRLGPPFVKLGQLIASSSSIFPQVLSDNMQSLLDEVPPFAFSLVHETVEGDLSHPIEAMFSHFDPVPIASASVSQVHACTLLDGRDAVMKVQRPNLLREMDRDLRIQYRLARLIERTHKGAALNATGIVEDLNRTLHEELNFLLEADRQTTFRANIHFFGDNKWITAPEVYWDACGPRVLCMERLYGTPIDEFDDLLSRGVDAEVMLRRGVKVWMEAAYYHGLFHGDVHAGNLWYLDDGRAAYLDFGLMGVMPPIWRETMCTMIEAAAIDHEYTRVVEAFQKVGMLPPDLPNKEFVAALMQSATEPILANKMADQSMATVFQQIIDVADHLGGKIDRNLVLVTKQLLYFERYVRALAPDWTLTQDLFLVRNIFPEKVAAIAAEEGLVFPDD